MPDSFAMARFKARLTRSPPKRPLTPEERERLLMSAITMAEIRDAARQLGLTFSTAYRERTRLYRRPPDQWPQVTSGP